MPTIATTTRFGVPEGVMRHFAMRAYLGLVAVLVLLLADPTGMSIGLGAAIAATGLAARLWVRGFRPTPGRFPDFGPYRFTRHPFYFGTFFAILGLSLACRSAPVMALAMLQTLVLFPFILREEEDHLRAADAFAYREYRAQVPRFFPSVMPFRGDRGPRPPFSLLHALFAPESREVNAVLLFAVAFGYLGLMMAFQPVIAPWRGAAAGVMAVFLAVRYARHFRRLRRDPTTG